MLAQRLLTAAIGIPIIVGVIYVGGVLFTAVVSVILAIAAIEFAQMMMRVEQPLWRPHPVAIVAAVGCAALPIIVYAGDFEWPPEIPIVAAMAMVLVIFRGARSIELPWWGAIVSAIGYVGFLGSYFVLLRELNNGANWVYWAVLSTWGTDTAAYAVGKLAGRHKMAPAISPGKTWEGTGGALVGGFFVCVGLGLVLDVPVSEVESMALGALIPGIAVLADLGESVLKRIAGVKDTSELVPGHGGFLDRLDSLLFTVPLVYLFAVWVVL